MCVEYVFARQGSEFHPSFLGVSFFGWNFFAVSLEANSAFGLGREMAAAAMAFDFILVTFAAIDGPARTEFVQLSLGNSPIRVGYNCCGRVGVFVDNDKGR